MGFILEEWVGDDNTVRYRTYPIFVGPFATRQQADEEAKKQKPQHGGFICVEREPTDEKPPSKMRSHKSNLSLHRMGKRDHRRR
jgi:hypothetical protein